MYTCMYVYICGICIPKYVSKYVDIWCLYIRIKIIHHICIYIYIQLYTYTSLGSAALLARELDESLGGSPVQVVIYTYIYTYICIWMCSCIYTYKVYIYGVGWQPGGESRTGGYMFIYMLPYIWMSVHISISIDVHIYMYGLI
jgi:hypothetical protein